MATSKLTITLDDEQRKSVQALVASGKAPSVSAFVRHAVAVALQDEAGWGAILAEALEQTGGPLTQPERAWADEMLEPTGGSRKPRRRAA